jgi:hypothetical protein
MVSKWILGRLSGGWSGFTWLRIGIAGGFCKCCNEPSGWLVGWLVSQLVSSSAWSLSASFY